MPENFKELLLEALKENLTIRADNKRGFYSENSVEISIEFDNETISTCYVDLPND